MAQFVAFRGKVVVKQRGDGPTVFLKYWGAEGYVPVSGPEWESKKRFVRYDANKMDRKTAYAIYEAAQTTKKKKEHEYAYDGSKVPAGSAAR